MLEKGVGCTEAKEALGREIDDCDDCPFPNCIVDWPGPIKAAVIAKAKSGIDLTEEVLAEIYRKKEWAWGTQEGRSSFNIYKAYFEEGSMVRVAKKLNVSIGTVKKNLLDWIIFSVRNPSLLAWRNRQILKQFTDGQPIDKLACNYGMSRRQVFRILRAQGAPHRQRGRPTKK